MSGLKKQERFNKNRLQLIYENLEKIGDDSLCQEWGMETKKYNPKDILRTYLLKSKKISDEVSEVSVSYNYSKFNPIHDEGRQFVSHAIGLQRFSRKIRHTITHDIYNDIDIQNAHFTLLNQYCDKKNYPHKYINRLVENNDKYMKELMKKDNLTKQEAKLVKIKLLNAGKVESNVKWIETLRQEIQSIQLLMYKDKENAEISNLLYEKNVMKVPSRLCHMILSKIENEILLSALKYFKTIGISTKNMVLIFDGFMVLKNIYDPTVEELEKLSKYVNKQTGYNVVYIHKPQDEIIDLSGFTLKEDDSVIVDSDTGACQVLLEHMKGRIISCNGTIYVKTLDSKIWTDNDSDVSREIVNVSIKLNIIVQDENGKRCNYSKNVSGIKNMSILIKSLCPIDNNFTETLRIKSNGKIFFENGVYDFKEGKLRSETEDDMTPMRINYNYNSNVDEKDIKYVYGLLNSIFEKNANDSILSDDATNMLKHISRGLAGKIADKDWIATASQRNSGKSIFTLMCENAFPKYVTQVNANNFLCSSHSGSNDEAKNMMWVINHMWSRILFANEIDISNEKEKAILNGVLIKKLASGGDKLRARRLYKEEIEFIFNGRIFFFMNEIPEIKPADACQMMTLFSLPNKFYKPNDYDEMKRKGELDVFARRGDPNLNEKVVEPSVRDAFMHIVLSLYEDKPVVNTKRVQEYTKDFRIDIGDELLYFKEKLDFSDKNYKISSKEILNELKKDKPNINAQSIKSFLTVNNDAKYGKFTIVDDGGISSRVLGYQGVKLRKIEEESNCQIETIEYEKLK